MGLSESEFQQLLANQAAANPMMTRRGKGTATESEAELERDVTEFLERDGWRALRTDPVSRRAHGKGFGELGMADHCYLRYRSRHDPSPAVRANSQTLWIEFKRLGEHPTPHQVAWHERERARGALTLIAGQEFEATLGAFCAWYAASGLER